MILFSAQLFLTAVVTGLALKWVSGKAGLPAAGHGALPEKQAGLAFYRGQIAAVEMEKQQGLLDKESAAEARLELARQVLAAEECEDGDSVAGQPAVRSRLFRLGLTLALLFLPLFSWAVYSVTGSAGMPARPFASLLTRDPATLGMAEKLVRAEVMASRHPEDGLLVDRLAGLYLEAGRFQNAANAYNRAIALNGESAPRLLNYAIALTRFAGGVVTDEAEAAFEQAAKLDPEKPDALVFLALGLAQNGKRAEAAKRLEAFLQTVPEDAPWRRDLAGFAATLRQQQTVAANIGKLTERLDNNPDDVQGWMMLVDAWLFLDRPEEAAAALKKGQALLPADKASGLAAFGRKRGVAPAAFVEEKTGG